MNEPNNIEMLIGEVNLNNGRSLRSQLFRHGERRIFGFPQPDTGFGSFVNL